MGLRLSKKRLGSKHRTIVVQDVVVYTLVGAGGVPTMTTKQALCVMNFVAIAILLWGW